MWTSAQKRAVRRLVAGAAMGVVLIPFATAWSGDDAPLPGEGLQPPGDCNRLVWRALEAVAGTACNLERNCDNVIDCDIIHRNIARYEACIVARQAVMDKCFRGGDAKHKAEVDRNKRGKANCEEKLTKCPIQTCPR